MAHVVIMPRQGNTVESCIIVGWKKKEGDSVEADTPICEVETDKATFEISAGFAGTILKIIHNDGDDVPVLQPIAVIGKIGEDFSALLQNNESKTPESKKFESKVFDSEKFESVPEKNPAVSFTAQNDEKLISPRAKNKAFAHAIDISHINGSGPGGRIIEADIDAFIASHAGFTNAAKSAINGNDFASLPETGSGIGGRIGKDDLSHSAQSNSRFETQNTDSHSAVEFVDTPIKGIRKVIADKMCESLATTAQFTLNASTPAVRLQELRKRFKESKTDFGVNGITINDLILFVTSRMLVRYPYMNAHKLQNTLRTFNAVHLGVAVDTPRGLMVPVIRNAHTMSLKQISVQAKKLAASCLDGSIKPAQLTGSTLTVTNLGNTGIESFTPVINIPEVAILGVCGISPKLAEKADGEYEVIPHISFSLTIDHAVVDGSPAAKFLNALCDAVKNIDLLLAE